MVERGSAFRRLRVKKAALETLPVCKTDSSRNTLPERACRYFDPWCQAVFGMAWGNAVHCAEMLKVIKRQTISGEIQLNILRQ